MSDHPMPYSAAERAAGIAQTPPIPYMMTAADLPLRIDERTDLLPALPTQGVQIVRGDYPLPEADARPAYVIERVVPSGATASFESSVVVPALQAAISALAAGIVVGLFAWTTGLSWEWPVVAFSLVLAMAWPWRLRFADQLLQRTETFTGMDINRDGRIGAPMQTYCAANPVAARRKAADARQTAEASAAQTALLEFMRRCYRVGCSEGDHGVKASGPDREHYVAARDQLFALGVAGWKNPQRPRGGWRMLVPEADALRIVAEHEL